MADTYIHRAYHDDVPAEGELSFAGQPADGNEVEIGGKVYTFQTTLTDSDGNVLIDGTLADTIANLTNAIVLGPGAGTKYAASTTEHPDVIAIGRPTTMEVGAVKTPGAAGNSITTTSVGANLSWGAPTLENGFDAGYVFWTSTSWDPTGTDYTGPPSFAVLTGVVVSLFIPDDTGAGGTPEVFDYEFADEFDTTVTLPSTPLPDTYIFFLNGVRLREGVGNDYTLTGNEVTMLIPVENGYIFGASYEF